MIEKSSDSSKLGPEPGLDAMLEVVGKRIQRIDAVDKVCGRMVYPSDRRMEGMLWVQVVRSEHPHARIQSIFTQEAKAVSGVVRVLTAEDVPGKNAFGIHIQDMPVLCHDRVRYLGDAVALVGAESKQAARQAASLVRVDYQVLDPLCDPQEAMKPSAVALHPKGNILHEGHFAKGDVEEGFRQSEVVVERVYQAQMMDHAFLETEAGLSYLDEQGLLTVESSGQYIYRDRVQIARALGLALDRVRVIGRSVGGAFGGKDEITVQIYLALMTFHTERPAKLVLSRPESMISHTKRHPTKMWYKTGASRSGKLLAVQARFISDTGAYASLGGPVLNMMLEHAAGPYRVEHVQLDGYAVYTNNGFSGALRGFGCTQACLAMESQMDLMARGLGEDPIAFRLANVLHQGDMAALGNRMKTRVGAEATLQAARKGRLYRERHRLKKDRTRYPRLLSQYIRRGVGVACHMKGMGLGIGILDHADVGLDLAADGLVTVRTSSSEMGQGAHTVLAQLVAKRLGISLERVRMVEADTQTCPDSGPTSASRTTYAVGNALFLAADKLEMRLGKLARERLGFKGRVVRLGNGCLYLEQQSLPLADLVGSEGLSVQASFQIPMTEPQMGEGLPHLIFSYGTQLVLVEVNTLTGQVTVEEVEAYLDCGRVIFRPGFEGQSEGGVAQGMGYALFEEVLMEDGRFLNTNFDTYLLPTSLDVPAAIKTVPIEVSEDSGPLGAKGIGESCTVGVAPAILNALHDAIGVRFTRLPVRAEDVLQALETKKS